MADPRAVQRVDFAPQCLQQRRVQGTGTELGKRLPVNPRRDQHG